MLLARGLPPSPSSHPPCSFKAFPKPVRQKTLLHPYWLIFKRGPVANRMLSFFRPQSWSRFADLSSGLLAGARWGHFSSAPTLCCRPTHTASPAPTDSYKKPQQLATGQLRKTLPALPSFLQLLLPQGFRGSANAIRSDPFFFSVFRLEASTPASSPWLTQLWVAGDVARLSSMQP